jgi:hypothetical protein
MTPRERPILFSGPMVRSILAGTKTQTRRLVRGPVDFVGGAGQQGDLSCWGYWVDDMYGRWAVLARGLDQHCPHGLVSIPCPYGVPGDRLWVKHSYWHYTPPTTNPSNEQAWDEITRCARWPSGESILDIEPDTSIRKHSDFDGGWKRRPSIHMPRWASRITLEVTDVRVQRLQEISEEDAQAECVPTGDGEGSYREGFASIWQDINGKRAPWASNPWVWAVSFSVVARG